MRASGSDRALACPGSLTLPVVRERPRYVQQAADYGTAAHGWKETGDIPDGKHGALILRKLEMNPIDRDAWWPMFDRACPDFTGEHEATYALNLLTGASERYSGPRDGADAWKKARGREWLTGTLDYLAVQGNTLWVSDLKTGRFVQPDSAQLLSYLLLVWTSTGRYRNVQLAASIDHWPRYPVSSQITRHFSGHISFLDLLDHERRLRYALEHPKEFHTGDHCTYCDGQPACTVYSDYVRNSNDTESDNDNG